MNFNYVVILVMAIDHKQNGINFISADLRKRIKKLHKREKMLLNVIKVFTLLGSIFLFLSFAPSIWYSMTTKVDNFSLAILETASVSEKHDQTVKVDNSNWQPQFDSKLNRATTIKIPSIGVDTVVNERTMQNYEDALRIGVWRVPDFGTPADRSKPLILAAHRFGYIEWSNLYRRKNSFYNLPKIKKNDLVEVVYKQRKYTYEVYGDSRGVEIKDYSADLILYTCETLNSNVRIFIYARLIQN